MSQIKKLTSPLLYPVKAGYRVGFCVFWNSFPFIILIFISTMVFLSCAADEPWQDTTPPGRRDYIWTQETLKTNPGDLVYLFSLWGSSPNNIWAVGTGVSSDLCIWHYNGYHWQKDGSRLSTNFISVFGFSPTDIWICGSGSGIWHHNENVWERNGGNSVPNYQRQAYSTIWGDNSDDIYAVGLTENDSSSTYRGLIQHFDGKTWKDVLIPEYRVGFADIKRSRKNLNYYLTGTRFESKGDTEKVFEYDGTELRQIYSGFNTISMGELNGELFFSDLKCIYTYSNNSFILWKDFRSTGNLIGRFKGRSQKDIFIFSNAGIEERLLHYNGEDLKLMLRIEGLIFDFFLFEKDIFVLTHDGQDPIVYHGSLEN